MDAQRVEKDSCICCCAVHWQVSPLLHELYRTRSLMCLAFINGTV